MIDDDPALRDLVGMVLEPVGWQVTMAPTAALGLLAIDTLEPDVVVLDLGLPDASGMDVLEALQADPATAWMPVVMLSADHQPDSATNALLGGAQDFMTKPFAPDELRARLAAALRVATAHRSVAEAERRFRMTFEEAPIGIALVSPEGRWLWVNRAICDMVGYDEAVLLGLSFQDVTHPDDLGADLALVRQLLDGAIERYQMEKRYLHADGHIVWAQLSVSLVRDDDGLPVHFVSQIQDITTLHDARELLLHRSLHDSLTGLPNRVLLFDRMEQAIAQEARHHRGLAVMFVDLDQMKEVNDAHGHDVGDALLVLIAERLLGVVRVGDTVARLGGDELVVLAESIGGPDGAVELAERVRAAMSRSYVIDELEVTCTASIGVAIPRPGQRPEDILREADRAMYRAKKLGKDRWVLVDESLQVGADSRRDGPDRRW